jgi:hypothetical protein
MKCPVCQVEMSEVRTGSVIGSLPGRPDMALREFTGYDCPTRNKLPHGVLTPHCTMRGSNTIITLFPYRLSSWDYDDRPSSSTLYQYHLDDPQVPSGTGRFTKVVDLPKVKITDEVAMLEKFAIYVLFS